MSGFCTSQIKLRKGEGSCFSNPCRLAKVLPSHRETRMWYTSVCHTHHTRIHIAHVIIIQRCTRAILTHHTRVHNMFVVHLCMHPLHARLARAPNTCIKWYARVVRDDCTRTPTQLTATVIANQRTSKPADKQASRRASRRTSKPASASISRYGIRGLFATPLYCA